jgi:hypothetical protein
MWADTINALKASTPGTAASLAASRGSSMWGGAVVMEGMEVDGFHGDLAVKGEIIHQQQEPPHPLPPSPTALPALFCQPVPAWRAPPSIHCKRWRSPECAHSFGAGFEEHTSGACTLRSGSWGSCAAQMRT